MAQTAIRIGPRDHGRRMSLNEFEPAEVEPGYLYELGRGVVVVSDVPGPRHFFQVQAIKRQFFAYDLAHAGLLKGIASGGECKVLLALLQSERHPDLAIYMTEPPAEDIWTTWIPEIVIEVVSLGSELRDYLEKREEYLQFGVREYWIIDAAKQEMLVLKRVAGRWTERAIRPPKVYRTRLLPGFEFNCAAVFEAARETPE